MSITANLVGRIAIAVVLMAVQPALAMEKAPEKKFITISTGGFYGVDFPVGSTICKLVNQGSTRHHVYCSVRRSSGPVHNLNRLRRNEVNFALAQSDLLKLALDGSSKFESPEPFSKLRGVLALYAQQLAIVAGKNSGVGKFLDFKGKTLNIGPEGSGAAVMYDYMATAYGAGEGDFKAIARQPENTVANLLCEGKIDGWLYVGGNPAPAVVQSLECGGSLIPVDAGVRKLILNINPQLMESQVPARSYAKQPYDVETLGIGAILVTTSDADPQVVKVVAESVRDNVPAMRRVHKVLQNLTTDDLLPRLTFLPVASGAKEALK
jgi:TRAP transporter TAXI family solute receptor